MLGMLHKTNTITGASHLGAKPFIILGILSINMCCAAGGFGPTSRLHWLQGTPSWANWQSGNQLPAELQPSKQRSYQQTSLVQHVPVVCGMRIPPYNVGSILSVSLLGGKAGDMATGSGQNQDRAQAALTKSLAAVY